MSQPEHFEQAPRIADLYFFLHAFELLGEWIYGSDWDGREYDQPPIDERKAERERLSELRSEFAQLQSKIDKLDKQKQRSLSADEIKRIIAQRSAFDSSCSETRVELQKLEACDSESFHIQFARWKRNMAVCNMLRDALAAGTLRAVRLPYVYLGKFTDLHRAEWIRQLAPHTKPIPPRTAGRASYRGPCSASGAQNGCKCTSPHEAGSIH